MRYRTHSGSDDRARPTPRPLPLAMMLRTAARWALSTGVAWLLVSLIWRTGAALAPFALGLLLAYLLLPVVTRLDRYLPRWGSIVVVYVVGLALLVWNIVFLAPPLANQISQVVQNVPGWYAQGEQLADRGIATFQQMAPSQIQAEVNLQVQQVQDAFQRNATTYAQRAGVMLLTGILTLLQTITFIVGFLVIPFFLFFVLVSADRLPAAIDGMVHPALRPDFWNMWKITDGIFGNYIRSQLVLGLIVGLMTFVSLWALRLFGISVPYIALLAIVAGFGELIPVVGPILSAIPAMIVVSGNGISAVLAVAVLYVVIQQVESQVLVPRIIGNTLKLNPAILLMLLVLAATTGGLPLVIVSAPLAAIGRDLFIYLNRRLREPSISPPEAIKGLLTGTAREPAGRGV